MSQYQTVFTIPYESLGKNSFSNPRFEKVLNQAIEKVFSKLGRTVKHAFYQVLKNNYGVHKSEIAKELVIFERALETTFGAASTLVEIQIIAELQRTTKRFGFTSNKNQLLFSDYLVTLKAELQP